MLAYSLTVSGSSSILRKISNTWLSSFLHFIARTYYEASAKAETVTAGIDEILYLTAEGIDLNSQDDAYGKYLENITAALDGQQIEGISLETQQTEAGCMVSFRVPAGARQELSVMLRITDYREHVHYYEVKTWEIVNRDSQETEQPLNLMPVIE